MSEKYDLAEVYAKLQKEEEAKAKKDAEAAKDFNNPDFLSMKVDNAYEMRLMYWTSQVPGERVVPIIEKTVHAVKTDDGYHEITCPSSDYLLGRSGYRACPICAELSKLWEEMEKGSATAKVVYDKFKRKFKGYAVVYVVNDPTTPENNGTFKILFVNAFINNFLREEIKGVNKKGIKIEGARPIGFKAFDPSANGKNLLVSVTKDGEYNKYTSKFVDPAEGQAAIDVDADKLCEVYDKLKFDEHYTPFDPEACKTFYEDIFLEKEKSPVEEAAEKKEEAPKEEKDENPKEEAKEEKVVVEEKAETPAKEEAKEEAPAKDSPNVDVDDILKGLPS
jgi:hypothetical protein